ncbi:hypothetical protein PVL29_025362 [Vitis rotundifolia]|uniref:Uncharacterized protein n=1 Tax=Vitis rotundifolia TaxID=103349 RepID=A0AA38YJK4_VITRO|nr:hypothetical protein PVL29_025362 [Vitis rotundifolia]
MEVIHASTGLRKIKSEASGDIGDLESILRHSFRGVQMNAKTSAYQKDETEAVKQSSTSKAELVKINASKVDGTRAVGANQAVEQITMPTIRRESTHSSRNLGKIPDGRYGENETRASERGVIC